MSKGSRIVTLRIPAELLGAITETMERAAQYRFGEEWTLTAFILTAIREKLAKMERSRKSGRRNHNTNE